MDSFFYTDNIHRYHIKKQKRTRIAVQPHTLANFNEKTWLPMTIHAR